MLDGAAAQPALGGASAQPMLDAAAAQPKAEPPLAGAAPPSTPRHCSWHPDAERELGKIPFFVRGRARRNTERFAHERGLGLITVDTLYDAKAHFGR